MDDGKTGLPRVDDETLELRMDQVERCMEGTRKRIGIFECVTDSG